MAMMQTHKKVESLEKSQTQRNNLSLGDTLRMLHPMSMYKNQAQVSYVQNTSKNGEKYAR